MVRPPLSPAERARGERLGALLRQARGARSMAEVAAESGIPVETLRKIETGRIATPAFFTVVALAIALGVDLDRLAARSALFDDHLPDGLLPDEQPPRAASALTGLGGYGGESAGLVRNDRGRSE